MPTVVAVVFTCSVCMKGFKSRKGGKVQMPCGHVYHEVSIAGWFMHHNTCPNCRCKIFQENLSWETFKLAC
ncbi:E3 ubiquitin-protein ligase RING1 [Morus notabilis]|uniref:RING-type E3 ubiquitin transferase n=1 Tax=Morus notabilis TaxID=981085 RepID=W9R9A5_9ROSA|nr:E3 ubiquitin-protein ligase RING1 [Morus notabilis]